MSKRKGIAAAIIGLAILAAAAPSLLRRTLWHFEQNPLLRGRLVAQANGCFNCHVPISGQELKNPGSRFGTVPRFLGGNAMMYESDPKDVEEFIRRGAPDDWLASKTVRKRLDAQHIRMPAFEKTLRRQEIDQLAVYVKEVEGLSGDYVGEAARGEEIAFEQGCINCHGVAGAGGKPNPQSLGGFIPGFAGGNYPDLVRNRAEFDEWVKTGFNKRLWKNPIVRYFWKRQRIVMPGYDGILKAEDLDALDAYIQEIRRRYSAK